MGYLQSGIGSPVHDDTLPTLVNIVVKAKESSNPVNQHSMVGRHLRELKVLVSVANKNTTTSVHI